MACRMVLDPVIPDLPWSDPVPDFVSPEGLFAAEDSLFTAARDLQKRGINARLEASTGWTPRHWHCCLRLDSERPYTAGNNNARDSVGWTPLFWATFHGNLAATRELLKGDQGAYLVPDKNGWTALMWAWARKHTEVVQLLLKHRENRLQALAREPKAFMAGLTFKQACQYQRMDDLLGFMLAVYGDVPLGGNKYRELGNFLLDADLNMAGIDNLWWRGQFDKPITNCWGIRGTHEQLSDGYLGRPKSSGPRLESGREWKARLLHTAIRDDNMDAVRLFLELGADVSHHVGGLFPALFAAANRKDPRYTTILLDHGADPSAQNHKRETPLQVAVFNGFVEAAAALIAGGADVNAYVEEEVLLDKRGVSIVPGLRPMHFEVANRTPLMLACGLRATGTNAKIPSRMVRLLLEKGASANTKEATPQGMSVIHYAARSRDFDIIRQILYAGADAKALDSHGRNAVHHYCVGYDKSNSNRAAIEMEVCLDLLVKHCGKSALSHARFETNEGDQGSNGETPRDGDVQIDIMHTPMLLAIARNKGNEPDWELFVQLHALGAKLHASDRRLDNYLDVAVLHVQPLAVRLLIHRGAQLSPNVRGWHKLLSCAESFCPSRSAERRLRELPSVIDALLPLGLDINVTGPGGKTFLHRVSANVDRISLPASLMALGADPRLEDTDGVDAFMQACIRLNYKTLRGLLEGSPHNLEGHWMQSIEIGKLQWKKPSSVLSAVCKAFTLFQWQQSDGAQRTAKVLSLGCKAGAVDFVKALLENGAEAHRRDGNEDEWTPLHFAAESGNVELVSALKGHVFGKARDVYGRLPLHVAASKGHSEIVKVLIWRLNDLDIPDCDGWYPIHFAAWQGDEESVRVLVKNYVDVEAYTTYWTSVPGGHWRRPEVGHQYPSDEGKPWTGQPLHLAAMAASAPIIKMLLDAGADVNACPFFQRKLEAGAEGLTRGEHSALRIVLDRGDCYGRREQALDKNRLDIALLLVERGADVDGVADHLAIQDVVKFEHHQGLWDKLRAGMSKDKWDVMFRGDSNHVVEKIRSVRDGLRQFKTTRLPRGTTTRRRSDDTTK